MRFIHLADVHLGAVPDRGYPWSEKRENEIWETFRRVIAGIRENPVDLLFIAGDLFHHQPLMSQLEEINELLGSIPDTRIFLMAGDQDYVREGSFYRQIQWKPNVFFFDKEARSCMEFNEEQVYVYGLSYEHPEIREPLYDDWKPQENENSSSYGKGKKELKISVPNDDEVWPENSKIYAKALVDGVWYTASKVVTEEKSK